MVSAEDFSFPKITNPLPQFSVSPSLWHVSSVVYPDDEREAAGFADYKSSSCFESGELDEEEKMDMLWEDFNEELQRVSSLSNKNQLSDQRSLSSAGGHQDLQLCCVQALNMSKPGSIYQPKKQSLVLVVKVLKKIFSLQNQLRRRTK
ncbi:hypothetical protein MANES_12G081400v8 [Manihot esculenta]|uniref:Uncharacterized protein n=1 Tax=Manihot esculenta TaxID=3983 RepID=A0A2C9UUN0_MANES|nr:hypothetical protein MANES_12G081400v8 [Manihot esculenta]